MILRRWHYWPWPDFDCSAGAVEGRGCVSPTFTGPSFGPTGASLLSCSAVVFEDCFIAFSAGVSSVVGFVASVMSQCLSIERTTVSGDRRHACRNAPKRHDVFDLSRAAASLVAALQLKVAS